MMTKPYADSYQVFQIDDGETHWCVAMEPEEALKDFYEWLDYKSIEDFERDNGTDHIKITECPPDRELTVFEDGDPDGPEKKTCREWAIDNRGIFCSTVW